MSDAPLDSRWLPALLGALVADVEFWYFASTGESDADFAGMALFAFFGLWWCRRLWQRRTARNAVAALGATLALVLMVLRQTGAFDRGYILPYATFVVFTLLSAALPG